MNLRKYIEDNTPRIILFLIANVITIGILWLVEVPVEFVFIVLTCYFLSFIATFSWDYLRRKKYYAELLNLSDSLDQKTLLAELIVSPEFLDGLILQQIMERNCKFQNDTLAVLQDKNTDYREYIDAWVHEIKTPITTAKLIIENDKNRTTSRIADELSKIDLLVEQVMYYARSSSFEKDFKVEQTTLLTIVNEALKTHSKQIILAKGKVEFDQLNLAIFADVKSCVFVLGQIIQNATKYHQENFKLRFLGSTERDYVRLDIADNGVGISSYDLPRVFEKGFTGSNGRCFAHSTGIGLYLVAKLCERMNIKVSISSKVGSGTTLTLLFPQERLLILQED